MPPFFLGSVELVDTTQLISCHPDDFQSQCPSEASLPQRHHQTSAQVASLFTLNMNPAFGLALAPLIEVEYCDNLSYDFW